jgi:hypothetical protein
MRSVGGTCDKSGGENKSLNRILVEKPEGKRPLERPKHK